MATLVNAKTNLPEEVPQDQVGDAFLSGTHNLLAGDKVALNDPDGNPVNVDASEVAAAVNQGGYSFPTQADLTEADNQAKYGEGIGNEAAAFGAGAARTATFGASDQLLTKSGLVSPNTLDQIAKRNPVSNFAGDATGVIAPMLVGDEAGPLNLVKGVSNVGKGVEGAVASLAPEGATAAQKILATVGSKAAGSAVEGAAYGAGQVVSEQALGDPDLTAQKAISQIGLSAVLGGGLGAAVGAGEVAIPPVLDAAKNAISKVYQTATGVGEDLFAKASSAVSGLPEGSISDALANRQEAFASPEQKAEVASQFADSLNDQYSTVESALKAANRDVRPIESEGLAAASADPQAVQAEATRIKGVLDDTIEKMRAQPELYPGRYATKLEEISDGLDRDLSTIDPQEFQDYKAALEDVRQQNADRARLGQAPLPEPTPPVAKIQGSPQDIFEKLNELKQNLDKKIKFGKIPSDDSLDAIEVIKGLRAEVKNSLQNPDVFGEAGARQAAFNSAQNEYLTAKKEFEKNFMYKTTTNSGAIKYEMNPTKVNTFFNQMGDARSSIKSSALDRFTKASQDMVNEIEKSYQAAPAKTFDADAISDLIGKNKGITDEAKRQAAISNNLKSITKEGSSIGGLAAGAAAFSHPVVGAALGAFDALSNPGASITRLANLERMAQTASKSIATGAKVLVSGSSKAFNVGRGEISAGLAKNFGMNDEDANKQFEKRSSEINGYAQNPSKLQDALETATSNIYPHAPNVSGSVQRSAVAGVSFLASKMPTKPDSGPLAPEWQPNRAEISKFNRYYDAVQNPIGILKQAAAGTLTTEGVEAVRTVYPQLYSEMTSALIDQISNKGPHSVPARSRLMLSLLTGKDMDGSTAPTSILANQSVYSSTGPKGPNQQSQGAVRTSQKGLSNLNVADNMLTNQQSNAQRKS